MSRASTGPKSRLSLELTPQARALLETLRIKADADSLTEVVRRALYAFEILLDARADGKTAFLRDEAGEEQRIVVS